MKRRVFITINLPDETQQVVQALQKKLRKFNWPVRWEVPKKLHVTIRFLGLITYSELERIERIIQRVAKGYSSFFVTMRGLVVYPSSEYPRVVCLSLSPNKKLIFLSESINSAIAEQKIGDPEHHNGASHITIARVRTGLTNFRGPRQLDFRHRFVAGEISIMESRLGEGSSTYYRLKTYNLEHVKTRIYHGENRAVSENGRGCQI